jgi:hypothetical protein
VIAIDVFGTYCSKLELWLCAVTCVLCDFEHVWSNRQRQTVIWRGMGVGDCVVELWKLSCFPVCYTMFTEQYFCHIGNFTESAQTLTSVRTFRFFPYCDALTPWPAPEMDKNTFLVMYCYHHRRRHSINRRNWLHPIVRDRPHCGSHNTLMCQLRRG